MSAANQLKKYGSLAKKFAGMLERAGIVDGGSLNSLYNQAKGMVRYSEGVSRSVTSIPWTFEISPGRSIQFREAETCSGIKPDVFCVCEMEFAPLPKVNRLNTVIRLWSAAEERAFRTGFDAETLRARLQQTGWRRVMLRIHFDYLPDSDLLAPLYHAQMGGRDNLPDEYCWFPDDIDVPRIMMLPVDLFQACEIIVANFFPSKYYSLCGDGHWNKALKWTEQHLIRPELDHLSRALESDSTVLFSSIPRER